MKRGIPLLLLTLIIAFVCSPAFAGDTAAQGIIFSPIEHATFVIEAKGSTIYVDPVGDATSFDAYPAPDIILITDIHPDHLDTKLVDFLKSQTTIIIGPQVVIDALKYGDVLHNGEKKASGTLTVEAIPMYNMTEERLMFHPKGRGNGYVVSLNGKRIYISGDTEDIPEMRGLKDIDYAFICMNLPYTMTVDQAVSAVLEFKPGVVFPYHYRGKEMFSDLQRFRKLLSKDKSIEVRLLKWYADK
jgi:L-ascorbate metabolism protein UlaG (beta-lactamase superfamily)